MYERIVPKLSYAFGLTSLSKKQCHSYNTRIRKAFAGPVGLNSNYPGAILYGPAAYGGMEFPEAVALQDQVQIPYFIKQLRWDKEVANDMLVTIDRAQLISGFVRPILEQTSPVVDFVDNSYIFDLRRRMREIDATLWIEKAWCPHLQRENDQSLMERFALLPHMTRHKMFKLNSVRLYLRVITLADLTDESGTHIPDGMLTGEWQAGSDLRWPFQPRPSDSAWALFRKCIRDAFSPKTPPTQRAHFSIQLGTPLGRWFNVPRATWFPYHRTQDCIYHKDLFSPTIYRMDKTSVPGFYIRGDTVTEIPLDAHPIVFQQVGEKVWTHRHHNIVSIPRPARPTPGHIVRNTLCAPTDRVVMGSDGSVHLRDQVCTAAWLIHQDDDHVLSAVVLLENISSVSSYRTELEGVFRCLYHLDHSGCSAAEAEHWCDNDRAVAGSNRPLTTPKGMLSADADVVLAIHALRQRLVHEIPCRHVYGHQDERNRKRLSERASTKVGMVISGEEELIHTTSEPSPHNRLRTHEALPTSTDTPSERTPLAEDLFLSPRTTKIPRDELPLNVRINVECDEMADETSAVVRELDKVPVMPPVLAPPYEGSRAMLRIGDKWITSHYSSHIYKAHRERYAVVYIREKYGWSDEEFKSVSWRTIERVRNKLRRRNYNKFKQTSKYMHGWLPVMHMRHHITGVSQCPGCPSTNETVNHMLRCPHELMEKKRREILAQLRKKGLDAKLPRAVVTALEAVLRNFFHPSHTFNYTAVSPSINRAIKSQSTLGIDMMIRGFVAQDWETALNKFGDRADRRMETLLQLLWDDVMTPLWKTRNDILHAKTNRYHEATDEMMSERIQWYMDHKHDVLVSNDHFLAEFDVGTLHRMSRTTKRKWIQHLDVARASYAMELQQRAKDQHVITRYFMRTGTPPEGDPTH